MRQLNLPAITWSDPDDLIAVYPPRALDEYRELTN
jgi:hypothetical protein